GGQALPEGSVLFKIDENGVRQPIRRFSGGEGGNSGPSNSGTQSGGSPNNRDGVSTREQSTVNRSAPEAFGPDRSLSDTTTHTSISSAERPELKEGLSRDSKARYIVEQDPQLAEDLATAQPKNPDQLTSQELRSETDLAAQLPRKKVDDVEQVNMPHGHRWRKDESGQWCRFSTKGCSEPGDPTPDGAQQEVNSSRDGLESSEGPLQLALDFDSSTAGRNIAALANRYKEVIAEKIDNLGDSVEALELRDRLIKLDSQLDDLGRKIATPKKVDTNGNSILDKDGDPAFYSHQDIFDESAAFTQQYRELQKIEPSASLDSLNIDAAPGLKSLTLEDAQKIQIKRNSNVLYVLRDRVSGAIIKVGETTGGRLYERIGRYRKPSNRLGLDLEIDIRDVGEIGKRGPNGALRLEKDLQEQFENEGSILPWASQGKIRNRTGREGPATPWEPLSSKSRLRKENHEWNRYGYLTQDGNISNFKRDPTREELVSFLKKNKDNLRASYREYCRLVPEKNRIAWITFYNRIKSHGLP
ncbi:MAG: hypothetical protein AAFY91_09935, partial [Bacteroidota bacterium]